MYHNLPFAQRLKVGYYYMRGLATTGELSRLYRITAQTVKRCGLWYAATKDNRKENQHG